MRRLPATRPGGRDRLLPPFTAQIALFPEQRKILAGELAEMGAENRVLAELAAQLEAAGDDPSPVDLDVDVADIDLADRSRIGFALEAAILRSGACTVIHLQRLGPVMLRLPARTTTAHPRPAGGPLVAGWAKSAGCVPAFQRGPRAAGRRRTHSSPWLPEATSTTSGRPPSVYVAGSPRMSGSGPGGSGPAGQPADPRAGSRG
jgi:hypothetical protein